MKRPNFFIVGAPKCATTAFAQYLSEHPDIFVTTPKEPNYFARHLTMVPDADGTPGYHRSFSDYLALYSDVPDTVAVVGEASTRYLRSVRAIREILQCFPDSRLLVIVRNPVDLFLSWHAQKLYEGQETEKDPRIAWRLQVPRSRGRDLPRGLVARDALIYGRIARIGSQVERVLRIFPRSQVQLLFLDDLRSDPGRVYREVLAFLGVSDDGRDAFPVVNRRKRVRWPRLQGLLRTPPVILQPMAQIGRRLYRSSGSLRALWRGLRTDAESDAYGKRKIRDSLSPIFEPEIRKLEAATGRDLSTWRPDRSEKGHHSR